MSCNVLRGKVEPQQQPAASAPIVAAAASGPGAVIAASNSKPLQTAAQPNAKQSHHAAAVHHPLSFKSTITVDISNASTNTDVVKMCMNQLGWQECSSRSF